MTKAVHVQWLQRNDLTRLDYDARYASINLIKMDYSHISPNQNVCYTNVLDVPCKFIAIFLKPDCLHSQRPETDVHKYYEAKYNI